MWYNMYKVVIIFVKFIDIFFYKKDNLIYVQFVKFRMLLNINYYVYEKLYLNENVKYKL